ncbi:MAG: adenylate/guanylate cyclase domain-containing protein [Desulfobacterales bacterium]|nr:adenylate/guanylate cyclase domain-containing protein [Desulfobacterales bacterium]
MKPSEYRSVKSFVGKTRIVLVLLGIIPFLLVVYLFADQRIELSDVIVLFAALALFSILAGFYMMRSSADQLVRLARETSKLDDADDDALLRIKSDQELQDISAHFNTVVKRLKDANKNVKDQSMQLLVYARDLALSYEKIKKEEELRSRLSRYIEKSLVEKLINSESNVLITNERRDVTILFADIRLFTTLAEKLPAEDVVAMLNEFFEIMVDIVFRNNGVLDKFVGDQLMAVFGLIAEGSKAPADAVAAAIEMQDALTELMQQRARQGQAVFKIGIGINSGSAIVGNVGSRNRMDYTVIGDCVNVAARLEEMAKGGEIITGEETYRSVTDQFRFEREGQVRLKNKSEPVAFYQVTGRHQA